MVIFQRDQSQHSLEVGVEQGKRAGGRKGEFIEIPRADTE